MTTDPALNDHTNLQRRIDDVQRRQRDLLDGLRRGQARFKILARSVWRVQEQEQRKLASELHDGIGQNLGAIASLIERALREPARAALEKAHELALSTLAETRNLSRLLRPQILDDLGLEPALRWLSRSMGETHGLEMQLELPSPFPTLDEERSTLVFRTLQEALTNIAKHAQAQHVQMLVTRGSNQLLVEVRDDGRGCDCAAALAAGANARGSGLGGMRDRLGLYDGELAIHSVPGSGFQLTATIPLPKIGASA